MLSTNLKIKHEWLVTHLPSFIRKSTARLAAWSNIFFICIKNPARFSQCMINKWPRVKCSATKKRECMGTGCGFLWCHKVKIVSVMIEIIKSSWISQLWPETAMLSNDAALTVQTMIWTDRLGYSIVFHYFAMKVLGLHSSCVYHIARFY